MLKSMGIVTIVDLDDYWMPGKEHPIHDIIRINKINEKIMANLKVSKYVTTTTTIFADEIKKLNRNVVVFPNAINPKEPQFCEPTIKSDKLRFGWLGGSSHLHDLMLLDGVFQRMEPYKNKSQAFLCGFASLCASQRCRPYCQGGEASGRRDLLRPLENDGHTVTPQGTVLLGLGLYR